MARSTQLTPRIFNLSPGPAVLPEEVLLEVREALWDLNGTGIGVLEHSHRGGAIDEVFAGAETACRELAGIPSDYRVLFLQGGASLQFLMLPLNFLPDGGTADYVHTGSWSKMAMAEAHRYGRVHVAASSEDANFNYVPEPAALRWSEQPVYAHFTSNNTIFGTQFRSEPAPPGSTWLACDASSDIFSRPLDVARYGLIYAGAQKNLGPAGVTLVIIREDLLERAVREAPPMLDYRIHAEQGSRYNTPPVFGVFVMGAVFRWLQTRGGLEAMALANAEKSELVYDAIDASDFFRGTARVDSRSQMNLTFRAPSEELEATFVAEAAKEGLSGLKGHRSVGGMRASLYNAFPRAGCEALAALMRDFESRRG
jgi:phosphoserine aminotransferase